MILTPSAMLMAQSLRRASRPQSALPHTNFIFNEAGNFAALPKAIDDR